MVNVSIVTYKVDRNELKRCLESLDSNIVSSIYIVDNASEPALETFLKKFPKVIYIASENVGYGAAHNKAIRATLSSPEITHHIVLNSDICFNPEILEELLHIAGLCPAVGIIQPKLTNPDGSLQYTARALPSPFDLILRRFLPASWFGKIRKEYLLQHLNHNKIINAPYLQGSFMFISVNALKQCGLFDERYFMYPEDIDLTRRINTRFYTIYYPFVHAVHNHRQASYKSFKMLWVHIYNICKYFHKWGWCERRRNKLNQASTVTMAELRENPKHH